MTFNDLIDLKVNLRLCDLIQLFLLGYDDKIYIDLSVNNDILLEDIRIIDSELIPFYECKINYILMYERLEVNISKGVQ